MASRSDQNDTVELMEANSHANLTTLELTFLFIVSQWLAISNFRNSHS